MASTLRKPTASSRSRHLRNELEALSRVHSPGFGLALSTAPRLRCQESTIPKLLVRASVAQIGDAVDISYVLHRKSGGSTVSVFDGNLAGRKLYAVSLFPHRTEELNGPPTWQQLFFFALNNSDLLLRNDCALGTWYHRRRSVHVLDIVICISDLQEALELGKCFDQQFIYDLKQHREIAILAEGGND